MRSLSEDSDSTTHSAFIESLSSYSRLHRAQRWEGTFSEFLSTILPTNPAAMARSSHQYIWDMLNWHGRAAQGDGADASRPKELFKRELFGIDEPLSRVVDYFKGAAAGSDVGRRLLLLLGPPVGRQVHAGYHDEAGPGGVQPHRRWCDVCDQGLAHAREPPEPRSSRSARGVPRALWC